MASTFHTPLMRHPTIAARTLSHPLSTTVHAASHTSPPDGERLSALINMAGRQRMLSQRLVLHAVLAAQQHQAQHQAQQATPSPAQHTAHRQALRTPSGMGKAPPMLPAALPVFRDTLELMTRSHERLAHGEGEWPGAFSEGLRQAYFAPRNADARIRDFLGLAQQVLSGLEGRRANVDDIVQELVSEATPILELLNELTLAHEAEAALRTRQERGRHQELMERLHAVAREAKVVAFNAQVAAHRAGAHGPEFGVVAARMGVITEEMEKLLLQARGR